MALPSIPGCGGRVGGFVLGQPSSLNATNCAVKQTHRTIEGGIGHDLPQEAPGAFADAMLKAGRS
jgi:hypothetical protein